MTVLEFLEKLLSGRAASGAARHISPGGRRSYLKNSRSLLGTVKTA